ncbi:RluA family pseudouridine synthase [Acaryochloris marina]|uniref:Pseudouridine synthase n=1 Tax=Acaryochloris marina (strain MBIC 11017) TaxID=329726 RepID=B0C246_ACAM1|nr:RluA family pseudouridine synthase [Acaryochloris marina]ABW27347.1 pseudouridine synthase, RluA family [Acaryochloris marina MBIC11017]
MEKLEFSVEGSAARIDRWLANQVDSLSRSHIQKLIEQGHVQINHKICTSKKYALQIGDQVEVHIPAPQPLALEPEPMDLEILFEDDHLLIVNKPAGLVVHPAPGHATGTLVHGLLAHCQDGQGSTLSGIGGVERPGIVHRLDKDTTGAIMVAKTNQAHQHLQAQIAAKTALREYVGLVYGRPSALTGRMEFPIGRHRSDRIKMAVVPEEQGGKVAVTHWQILQPLGNYALVKFRLETGRTHQIRVHCAQMGWPIVGDPLYSRGRSLKVNLSGQVLHAWRLSLKHPVFHTEISVQAPLPIDFVKLLNRLQQQANLKPMNNLLYPAPTVG